MITDILENAKKYYVLNKNFESVFNYLKSHDLKNMACGKYEINGNEVFVNLNEYETKPVQKLEAHKKYIDIQVLIEGEEYMGYTNITNTSITEEYDKEKDVVFLTGETDKIKATAKTFFIFYPEDAHMPALSIKETKHVKKAIFKISV